MAQDLKHITYDEDGWPIEKETVFSMLWRYRDLTSSLLKRDIRSRYKQSILGFGWAIIQPLAVTLMFTIVMSYIAKIPTPNNIPYPIFAYIGMLPWQFFSGAFLTGTECLINNIGLITKIYFPREIFPLVAIVGRTVDFGLSLAVLLPLFIIFHKDITFTWWMLMLFPLMFIVMILVIGVVFFTATVNLFFRDVRHAMPLIINLWMYLSPVPYDLSLVPEKYMTLYMLNPMVSLINGVRSCVLYGQPPQWGWVFYSLVVSIVLLVLGYKFFKKLDPLFAESI